MITIREGCEGGELNFIGTLEIFNTNSSKLHGYKLNENLIQTEEHKNKK